MSNKASEQMMGLLQELAALKAIDSAGRPRNRGEKSAWRERQRHRTQIREQIKQIARTNNKPSQAPLKSRRTRKDL
jgi:hypothetical protein